MGCVGLRVASSGGVILLSLSLIFVSSLLWMIHGINHAPMELERLDGSAYLAESRSASNRSLDEAFRAVSNGGAHSTRML